jgi:para-nitrobenzyl esterase
MDTSALFPDAKKEMEQNPVKPRPLRMNEDCLSLNVWTPAEDSNERLPVMVWFHGGGLQFGTSDDNTFDGEGLCQYGVILVTANYRTGVFGYFGHPELEDENKDHSSGNYGLQDQIFALRWLHDNVTAFGGDPGNVTIFGCSGGGRSVQGICCSPLSKGLVHHAVCHSAGGLNPDYSMTYKKLKELGKEFVEFCGKKNIGEMRDISAETLQKHYEEFIKWFNITGDGYVLPYTMDETIRRNEHADIDYILSTTNHEIPRLVNDKVTLENFSPSMFGERSAIFGAVCKPTSDEEAADYVMWQEAYEMKSAQLAWAMLQASKDKKPVYLCTFDRPMPGVGLARHGDDQFYVFHTLRKFWMPFTEDDESLSQTMMRYWTNFAKTGDPNGEGLAEWTRFTTERPLTMSINTDRCEMRNRIVPVMERLVDAYIAGRRE